MVITCFMRDMCCVRLMKNKKKRRKEKKRKEKKRKEKRRKEKRRKEKKRKEKKLKRNTNYEKQISENLLLLNLI
jgi:hypothetical protein